MLFIVGVLLLVIQIVVSILRTFSTLWKTIPTNIKKTFQALFVTGFLALAAFAFFFTNSISQYVQTAFALLIGVGGFSFLFKDQYAQAQITLFGLGLYLIGGLSIPGIVLGLLVVASGVFFERILQLAYDTNELAPLQVVAPQKQKASVPIPSVSTVGPKPIIPIDAKPANLKSQTRRSVEDIMQSLGETRRTQSFSPNRQKNSADTKNNPVLGNDVANSRTKDDTNSRLDGADNMNTKLNPLSETLPQRPQAPKPLAKPPINNPEKPQSENFFHLEDDSLKAQTTSKIKASEQEAQKPVLGFELFSEEPETVQEATVVESAVAFDIETYVEEDEAENKAEEVEIIVVEKNLDVEIDLEISQEAKETARAFTFRGRGRDDYVRSPFQPMKSARWNAVSFSPEEPLEEESILSFRQRDDVSTLRLAKPRRSSEFFDSWNIKRDETQLEFNFLHPPILEKCHAIEGVGSFKMAFRNL